MSLNSELISNGNWLFRKRSYLPLLILPLLFYSLSSSNSYSILLLFLSIMISSLGEFVRIITIAYTPDGTSGRNTKGQFATTINILGIYSAVRHPLYLGNFLIYLGPFIYTLDIYMISIFILIFWIYYERIMYTEENYLINKFGIEFENWSKITPAFIPNIFLYKKNNTKFSIKKVLFGEYAGISGIILLYIMILLFQNYTSQYNFISTSKLYYILFFNSIVFIIIRILKKYK